MKAYLRRLLALLEQVARTAPQERLPVMETILRLDELLGLSPELFPAAVRLSPGHAAQLVRALRRALGAYRVYVDLPDSLPARRQYAVLVARLGGAAVVYYGVAGTWLECCAYDPAQCDFPPAYCACRALVEEATVGYGVVY